MTLLLSITISSCPLTIRPTIEGCLSLSVKEVQFSPQLNVDLKEVVTPDVLTSKDKKVTALKETKKRFEERFKTGKNRWFFTKLRF